MTTRVGVHDTACFTPMHSRTHPTTYLTDLFQKIADIPWRCGLTSHHFGLDRSIGMEAEGMRDKFLTTLPGQPTEIGGLQTSMNASSLSTTLIARNNWVPDK